MGELKLRIIRALAAFSVAAAAVAVFPFSASAQSTEDSDSLVVLISSKSAQIVDVEGSAYRKVIGPARFFHNNTYLLCDTAFWSVDGKYLDAIGNVQILQEETVLSGDKLTYLIDDDLAQFRGSLVQLTDKDNNTLRTRNLDYNTKDSVAIFREGGAMRDKDGQIIESLDGTYDSKAKLFTFKGDVNMFSDTVFVKTNSLNYNSETSFATFGTSTDLWNKENMLSADAGWYDRSKEIFLFNRNVHLMSADQEAWCDSVYYYRAVNDVTMLGHVQIVDTTRNVSAVAGKAEYKDALSKITMRRNPAVIAKSESSDGTVDTVYVAADFIDYYTLMKFKVDSLSLAQSAERLKMLETDAVGTFRKKAAEEAAKAAEQAAMENDANFAAKKAAEETRAKRAAAAAKGGDAPAPVGDAPQKDAPGKDVPGSPRPSLADDRLPAKSDISESLPLRRGGLDSLNAAPVDSLGAAVRDSLNLAGDVVQISDSLEVTNGDPAAVSADSLSTTSDSLSTVTDSLSVAKDTVPAVKLDSTKIGFMTATNNVRLFRSDAQIVCDSLLYSDLDSIARLYVEPVVWQETVRQYSADSIYVVVRDGTMDRASLMSDAFICIEEDKTHYDQIKSAEMMAFFENGTGLRRFDALGGAQALFFVKENDALATVNKTDSKMLSAIFKDGDIQRVYYFETAKSDGYPVVQMKEEEKTLKGFKWQPERRPADRHAVTDAEFRSPERKAFLSHPQASFRETNRYFPGYMKGIYKEIAVRDSLQKVRAAEDALRREQLKREKALADSLALVDSLAQKDTLVQKDTLALKDSLAITEGALASQDSLSSKDILPSKDSLALSDSLSASDSIPQKAALPQKDTLASTARKDSLVTAAPAESVSDTLSKAEQKALKAAQKKAEKEARKKAREEARAKKDAEREAKWQEKERIRKEKEAAKEQKKLEKLRAKKRKALEAEIREAQREAEAFEKYRRETEQKQRSAAGKKKGKKSSAAPLEANLYREKEELPL